MYGSSRVQSLAASTFMSTLTFSPSILVSAEAAGVPSSLRRMNLATEPSSGDSMSADIFSFMMPGPVYQRELGWRELSTLTLMTFFPALIHGVRS